MSYLVEVGVLSRVSKGRPKKLMGFVAFSGAGPLARLSPGDENSFYLRRFSIQLLATPCASIALAKARAILAS